MQKPTVGTDDQFLNNCSRFPDSAFGGNKVGLHFLQHSSNMSTS